MSKYGDFPGPYFSVFLTEYSVQMCKNTTRKNSVYGHFSDGGYLKLQSINLKHDGDSLMKSVSTRNMEEKAYRAF